MGFPIYRQGLQNSQGLPLFCGRPWLLTFFVPVYRPNSREKTFFFFLGAGDSSVGEYRWNALASLPPGMRSARSSVLICPVLVCFHDPVWDQSAPLWGRSAWVVYCCPGFGAREGPGAATCFAGVVAASPCWLENAIIKSLFLIAAELFVDGGHLTAPAPPLPVIQSHQRLVGPVQIIGQKRHLLIEALLGVERHPPGVLQRQWAARLPGKVLPGGSALSGRLRGSDPPDGKPFILRGSPL